LRCSAAPIDDRRHRNTLYPLIAFMPQGLGGNLYPELSISENIRFFGTLFGLSKDDCEQRMANCSRPLTWSALPNGRRASCPAA
jgi:ABC-type Na+ transport system ATPase subunit NatA